MLEEISLFFLFFAYSHSPILFVKASIFYSPACAGIAGISIVLLTEDNLRIVWHEFNQTIRKLDVYHNRHR